MPYPKSIPVILVVVFSTSLSVSADIMNDSKVIDISGGDAHTLIITTDNRPRRCGSNSLHQLGIGDTINDQPFSDEQIQEMIDWTEQLWESNEDLRAMVDPENYERVIESLKEELQQ